MSKKTKRVKLPKRFLGVKIPKATRKQVNGLLKGLPPSSAKPALDVAVGTLMTALAARLEEPLRDLIESYTAHPKGRRKQAEMATPTAH